MILAGLMALFFIIIGFKTSIWFGIFALLIGAPLLFLLTVISNRVVLELILVIYRLTDRMENIRLVDMEERPESRDGIQWNV
jgi:membrane protein implicated in regulation of membrane protease activity